MTEDTTDGPEVLETAPVEPQSAPDQEDSPTPDVSDDAAQSETPSEGGSNAKGAKERIQQLVGDKKAAMEYGNFWKDKFEASNTQSPQAEVQKPTAPVMPTLKGFDYDDDAYSAAMANYTEAKIATTVDAAVSRVMEQTGQKTAATQADADWQSRVKTFASEHADFEEVASNPLVKISEGMAQVIKASDNGPELAYHLGQNPADAQRIASLPPVLQGIELGKLNVSTKTTVAQKQVTSAPDPMSPVGSAQPSLSTKNETIEDFMARRNEAQHAARRR